MKQMYFYFCLPLMLLVVLMTMDKMMGLPPFAHVEWIWIFCPIWIPLVLGLLITFMVGAFMFGFVSFIAFIWLLSLIFSRTKYVYGK